ncbi:acetylglucosamine transferase [Bradyrhizobium sacchari]|uniref:protein O-GlcNAc transferase n=1 Tax=Bradyrhizobium sacchari TaxID=1399419 RepID=A0A560KKJ8_9BRAD|nr:glycosyltransferase family 41 protein [Bradyrhizobium sacchari]OPY95711.1 acetylglucosamine transferase [Bradyrhizobium sacchari]TWB66567.1 putative O-linked N-acetylglucosamine transferase (SPINDLY family) [Bradyrhizobium sacchari]TWB83803.1 putative O-linked N-acetylglucosamine transferase (SPINDLY family) [Bradyrhizobium sacchari]
MRSNGAGARAFQNARLQKKLMKQADAIISTANAAYGQARYAQTEALCRQILNELPQHFGALHLLGLCAFSGRHFAAAKQAFKQAVTVDPRSAQAFSDLGATHFALGEYEEARTYLERAIALKPNLSMALANLGNTLLHLNRVEQAIELYDRAIRLKPDHADALCNRGVAELALCQLDRARQSFERALQFQPRNVEALVGKGLVNIELKNFDEAKGALETALAIRPGSAKILANRGRLNFEISRLEQAAADFDAALAISPKLEVALQGKAQVSLAMGNTAQAILACTTLLEENPRSANAMALMSACFANQGEIASAIELLDAALAIVPDASLIGRKIFFLDYLSDANFAVQQAARTQWWDAIGAKLAQRKHAPRRLDPDRRIVIGYVAAEFWFHSAGFTLLPVLAHHDHSKFEIVCYSCAPVRDEMTAKFESLADVWVEAGRLSDDQLIDRIDADKVDILIDVSGHTIGNRLPVFARKPVPIQVSGFGHATGTGLRTMDYLLADPVFIPQSARHLLAEKVHDLPCLITIDPILDVPPSELPMLRNGYVTFGVFNRIYKISDEAIRVWSRIMREVPGSRIVVKHTLLDDLLLRDSLLARFVAQGVTEDRVTCLGSTPRAEHLRAFANIDISLDTFPQNGGVSTWESLYAGVPVVAKLGHGASSRAGGAIVTAVGLGDWVAEDDEGYAEIACKFAAQSDHLTKLRADLPTRIAASAAGNVELYTREVEAGYRRFWRDYCAAQGGKGP